MFICSSCLLGDDDAIKFHEGHLSSGAACNSGGKDMVKEVAWSIYRLRPTFLTNFQSRNDFPSARDQLIRINYPVPGGCGSARVPNEKAYHDWLCSLWVAGKPITNAAVLVLAWVGIFRDNKPIPQRKERWEQIMKLGT